MILNQKRKEKLCTKTASILKKIDHKIQNDDTCFQNQPKIYKEWKLDAEREHKLNSHTRNVY